MEFNVETTIAYPRQLVFETLRDHIVDLVPYLPDVDKIKVVERKQVSDTEVFLLNHWFGKTNIPAMVKSILKPEMLQWKDHANWYADQFYCSWRLESLFADNLFACSGTNTFAEHGEAETRMNIKGRLDVYAERAVPSLMKGLAKKLGPQIEKIVVRTITPNFTTVAQGIQKYLDAQKKL
jgi:hypothetical protein